MTLKFIEIAAIWYHLLSLVCSYNVSMLHISKSLPLLQCTSPCNHEQSFSFDNTVKIYKPRMFCNSCVNHKHIVKFP